MTRFFFFFALSLLLSFRGIAAEDEKPQLMSRTGGGAGDTWSSPAELKKDAEAGKPPALTAFGEMLLTGDQEVPKDVPRGIAMLERAAQAGQANAAFRLGKVYDDGELAPRDATKAIEYYRQAALAGVSEAQYNLGSLYVSARGVKRDYKEGLAWLIVAKKNGVEAEGEKQVRDRLKSGSRAHLIPEAEARAAEIQTQLAQNAAKSAAGPASVK